MAPHADSDVLVTGATDTTSVVISDPVLVKDPTKLSNHKTRFNLEDVFPHRQQSAPMPPGVASFASADMFKSKSNLTKPKAKRWDHRISPESASRKPSSLKGAMKYFTKETISLCGGLPSSDYFPFQQLSVKVPVVPEFSESESIRSGQTISSGKHDVPNGESLYDLSIALNYGQSMGPPQLMRFITEHTEIVHDPPYSDWDICMTVGSTSALDISLRMFCQSGDHILTDEYTFSSAIETALPMGIKPVGIKMDADGMIPSHLDEVLSTWDTSKQGRKPQVIYLIPTGQNPTASTQPLSRRKEIYTIAEKHDLIILEDEPYYFLQMDEYKSGQIHEISQPFKPTPSKRLLENLIPSYLSLDKSGRVVRLDSFSKIIAPGARAGWVVASQQITERFVRHQEVSSQTPSGFSLMALYKLLEETWGHEGFLDWLSYIRAEYTRRRDIIMNACETHLPREVCEFVAPKAGMFHWIRINARKHPDLTGSSENGLLQIEEKIFLSAVKQHVLIARGSWFKAEKESKSTGHSEGSEDCSLYFRMTFAAASEEAIIEAVRRFGIALKEEFGLI